MTVDEAFKELMGTKGVYKALGITSNRFSNIRFDYNTQRRNFSLDMKVEMLRKAGYVVEIGVEKVEQEIVNAE